MKAVLCYFKCLLTTASAFYFVQHTEQDGFSRAASVLHCSAQRRALHFVQPSGMQSSQHFNKHQSLSTQSYFYELDYL
jgi:hypothetical protein